MSVFISDLDMMAYAATPKGFHFGGWAYHPDCGDVIGYLYLNSSTPVSEMIQIYGFDPQSTTKDWKSIVYTKIEEAIVKLMGATPFDGQSYAGLSVGDINIGGASKESLAQATPYDQQHWWDNLQAAPPNPVFAHQPKPVDSPPVGSRKIVLEDIGSEGEYADL